MSVRRNGHESKNLKNLGLQPLYLVLLLAVLSVLFACVILVGVYSLYVGFSQEIYVENSVQKAVKAARDDHELQRAVTLAAEDNT